MNTPDEPPPFLRTWKRVYAAVMLYLVAMIAVFFWFTERWNR
jgi:hypothetical protein